MMNQLIRGQAAVRALGSWTSTGCSVLALTWGLSTAALAQSQPGAAQGATAPAAPQTQGQPAAGSDQLETVVVTASRHAEDIQKESRPISVLTAADLERDNVIQAQSLNALVPGLQVANSGDQLQIYVRGVGDRTVTSQTEQAVAFNFDDVYVPRAWEGTLAFFDDNRVELLKGPQGTLYGRNASAGALNVIPNLPTLDSFGGNVEAEVGNYGEHMFEGALNVPVDDKLALRFSFQTNNHDGYLSNGEDDADSQAGRVQLLYQPRDDLSFRLDVDYSHNGGAGQAPVALPLLNSKNPWIALADNGPVNAALVAAGQLPILSNSNQNVNTWIVSGHLNWNFDGMTLTVIPAFVGGNERQLTYAGGIPTPEKMDSSQPSIEVRLSSADQGTPVVPGLQWTVGGYASHEDLNELDLALEGAINGITDFTKLDDTTWGIFGEGKYSLLDDLRIIGGMRYTAETKNADGSLCTDFPPDVSCPNAGAVPFGGNKSFSAVNWRTGLEYDVTPENMAYFTVSTGFKAGGFFAAPPPENTYEPERLTAYELGLKNRFLDDRLQANVELFYWDYANLQEQFISTTGTFIGLVTRNAARATLQGVDASASYLITDNDEISAEAEFNDSKYNSFNYNAFAFGPPVSGCATVYTPPTASFNCSGKELVKSPLWSGAASYQHTFPISDGSSLVFEAREHFSSGYWLAEDFTPEERTQPYHMTDLNLTYNFANRPVSLTAYVQNLENTPVYNYAVQGAFITNFAATDIGPPQTYGVRLNYAF